MKLAFLRLLPEMELLSVDEGSNIEIWNLDGKAIADIGRHNDLTAIDLPSNGKWLVSGGHDQTVRIWQAKHAKARME